MKFLNKVFSGDQTDKAPLAAPATATADLSFFKDDLILMPLDPLASGDPADTATPSHASPVKEPVTPPAIEQELAYLEKYESLQTKMNVNELYDIFKTLDSVSHSVADMNQNKTKPDEFLETWKPLLTHIEAFTLKKQLLQSIEAQMNQTIGELREIHQQMFDSISQVRAYNSEREAMYALRRQLADDLEKKLRLM